MRERRASGAGRSGRSRAGARRPYARRDFGQAPYGDGVFGDSGFAGSQSTGPRYGDPGFGRPPYAPRSNAHFNARRFRRDNLIYRLMILLLVALLIGVIIGLLLPIISKPLGQLTGRYEASGPVAEVLAKLPVNDHPTTRGYDRESFGYNTTDDDGNGCTIRDDVLARDLKSVIFDAAKPCRVRSGMLDDPYTGRTIHFVRGQRTSAAVQIDHVVALENAWQSGANAMDSATRRRYGNDGYNLLAVDGPANQEKGSASAAYWLPANTGSRCSYVARQVGVKDKYHLSMTTAEKRAISSVLRSCPSQTIPSDR